MQKKIRNFIEKKFLSPNRKKILESKFFSSKTEETLYDKFGFRHIFIIWIFLIFIFGLVFHYATSEQNYLLYTQNKQIVLDVFDSIYFSFVTATTTGFGDITPVGFFKFLSVIEVILGLVLIAVVTSKLISIKQNTILTEVYELSFQERLNRLRSSFILFKQNINIIVNSIEDGSIRPGKLEDIEVYLSSFKFTLDEVYLLFSNGNSSDFIKKLDSLNAEVLFNNIIASIEKINILYFLLNSKKIHVAGENSKSINECLKISDKILQSIGATAVLSTTSFNDATAHYSKVRETLIDLIEKNK
jgi:hypothetical protein